MNWSLLLSLATAGFTTVAAALLAHRYTAARDQDNRRRDLRVTYLLDAYRRLAAAGNRPLDAATAADMEQALADVQLLGSQDQARLAVEFARTFAAHGQGDLDDLLRSLRDELRGELRLQPAPKPVYLRITHPADASTDGGAT